MDFSLEYSEDQEQFATEVRAWLEANVPEGLDPIRDVKKMPMDQWEKRREFVRALGKKGWLYPRYPAEYGGGGLGIDSHFVLNEELAKRGFALPPLYDMGILCSPAILACGTEEQKKRHLPPMFGGDVMTWQLFTEPEAGTDAANQQTNALHYVKKGDHFVVNGQKIFVGAWPSKPEQFYLLTRSDIDAPRHQNLTSFVIPTDLPGITVQPLDLFIVSTFPGTTGPTGANTDGVKHTVFFDDVKVPESCMIGREGEGWKVTTATLDVEQGGGFGGATGNWLVEGFFDQCRSNPAVLRRLRENPQLVDSVIDIYAITQIQRLWGLRNATGQGGHYGGPQLALHRKISGTKIAPHMAKVLGPQIFADGGQWNLDDGLFEISQRCAIALAPGGTPESYKINISRALAMGR